MKYYSAIKKNESMNSAYKWMELGKIILSEVTQKDKCHIFPLMCISWNITKEKRVKYDDHVKRFYISVI